MCGNVAELVDPPQLEFEGDTLPAAFWREFANISRDVGPDAASLRNDSSLFV